MKLHLSIIFIYISILAGYCQKYQFKHIDVSNGLPNNFVRSIYKDKDGFMWFGTQTGLCRYDGYDLKNYFHIVGDNTSIPDNTINSIQEATDNKLVVETMKGYAILDKKTEKFSSNLSSILPNIDKKNISKVYIQSDDKIWIFSTDNGGELYCNDKLAIKLDHKLLNRSNVTDIKSCDNDIILVFNYGQIVCIDSEKNKIRWINADIRGKIKCGRDMTFSAFITNKQTDILKMKIKSK